MTLPSVETIASYLTIAIAIFGVLLAAFWLSLVVWAVRDMRSRSRDPFASLLAGLTVLLLPFVGILIYWVLRPPQTLTEVYEGRWKKRRCYKRLKNGRLALAVHALCKKDGSSVRIATHAYANNVRIAMN